LRRKELACDRMARPSGDSLCSMPQMALRLLAVPNASFSFLAIRLDEKP
jgi:hypothetical protein